MKIVSNNLNIFRVLFIVKGILSLGASLLFLLYMAFGGFLMSTIEAEGGLDDFPFNPGMFVVVIGCIGFLFSLAMGIVTLMAAKYIRETRKYTFVFVVSVLNCLTGVLGILLGVFTLIEINKPHIKALFDSDNSQLTAV